MTPIGRPMRGMVHVAPEGYTTVEALSGWLQKGVDFASSLPAKG